MSGNLMERQKDGVRSSVSCCLTRVLGTDQHARKVAEQELKTLEVTEGHNKSIVEILAINNAKLLRIWSCACRNDCIEW